MKKFVMAGVGLILIFNITGCSQFQALSKSGQDIEDNHKAQAKQLEEYEAQKRKINGGPMFK